MADNETVSESGVVIGGVDGSTPLGFLAALGLLRVLSERHSAEHELRLSWAHRDAWRPVLHGVDQFDAVVDMVMSDAAAWADAPLLQFRYVKVETGGPKVVGGLKAPAAVLRAFLLDRRERADEATLEYLTALMIEEVTDDVEKPATLQQHQEAGVAVVEEGEVDRAVDRTFFDFTARNAQFLEQVGHVRKHLHRDGIAKALEHAAFELGVRSLDWDPAADTPGAIYTGYARGSLPVHEWLAFRSVAFFPLAARRGKVVNTACTGRRLDGEFTWPLWDRPIGVAALRSLVSYPWLASHSADQRQALGLAAVFSANLTKKADGRSGMFSPSRPR